MNKIDILKAALSARDDEILNYQINIDNYACAIKKINEMYRGNDEISLAMQEFKAQLENIHLSSVIEQTKAKIIRDVISDQLEGF